MDLAFFMPTAAAALDEQRTVYSQICQGIEELTRKVFNDFANTVDPVNY